MIHLFLRSIGFSELNQNADLYRILEEIIQDPDEQALAEDSNGNEFACFSKYFSMDYCGISAACKNFVRETFGITVCGNFIRENEFRMEYYYPFLYGSNITTCEPVEVERHSGQESFLGVCDDLKVGLPLIFHVTNVVDVLREKKFGGGFLNASNVVMSGLAYSGKILLPTAKSPRLAAIKNKTSKERMNLMQRAREGSSDAMENLTLNDMDTYAIVSRRALKEDVLTIVESSLIPYGTESDQYTVIGEIQDCFQETNRMTGEKIWILTLLCNELCFDVCVNEKFLIGEPEIGRRFKGRIWMQGYLNFDY